MVSVNHKCSEQSGRSKATESFFVDEHTNDTPDRLPDAALSVSPRNSSPSSGGCHENRATKFTQANSRFAPVLYVLFCLRKRVADREHGFQSRPGSFPQAMRRDPTVWVKHDFDSI